VAYPRGEVGDLHEALTALHALVGAPTDRQLESYASLADRELPRATANTVRRGHGTPAIRKEAQTSHTHTRQIYRHIALARALGSLHCSRKRHACE
jgi:hypothetical protein